MTIRALDHTADIGFEHAAPDPEALFEEAGRALSDTITEVDELETDRRLSVQLEASDREALMVEWLGELLFRFDVEGFLGRDFRVELEGSGDGWTLRAEARGTDLDPSRHAVKTAVKAATWHQLRVAEEDGRWTARVILDV